MPELPEVETIRRDLREKILGKEISRVDVLRAKIVRADHGRFKNFLKNKKIKDIDRVGKLLMFDFGDQHHLFVHLKMTGQLIYVDSDNLVAGGHSDGPDLLVVPNVHTRAVIYFVDSSVLYFNDMRAFGYLQLANELEKQAVIKKYGIEPLADNFTINNFEQALKGKKTTIKAVLLNQGIISGIGNIYADEVCFEAKIKPIRLVSTLTKQDTKRLYTAIQKIIKKAIQERGTTFNNYVDPHGKKGNFLSFLKVYGKGGEPCLVCKNKLKKVRVAARGTVFCSVCQK